jgi:hypothetical protein
LPPNTKDKGRCCPTECIFFLCCKLTTFVLIMCPTYKGRCCLFASPFAKKRRNFFFASSFFSLCPTRQRSGWMKLAQTRVCVGALLLAVAAALTFSPPKTLLGDLEIYTGATYNIADLTFIVWDRSATSGDDGGMPFSLVQIRAPWLARPLEFRQVNRNDLWEAVLQPSSTKHCAATTNRRTWDDLTTSNGTTSNGTMGRSENKDNPDPPVHLLSPLSQCGPLVVAVAVGALRSLGANGGVQWPMALGGLFSNSSRAVIEFGFVLRDTAEVTQLSNRAEILKELNPLSIARREPHVTGVFPPPCDRPKAGRFGGTVSALQAVSFFKSLQVIREVETIRRLKYDWVVKLRPDISFGEALPPLGTIASPNNSFVITSANHPPIDDMFAVMPRDAADAFLGFMGLLCREKEFDVFQRAFWAVERTIAKALSRAGVKVVHTDAFFVVLVRPFREKHDCSRPRTHSVSHRGAECFRWAPAYLRTIRVKPTERTHSYFRRCPYLWPHMHTLHDGTDNSRMLLMWYNDTLVGNASIPGRWYPHDLYSHPKRRTVC